MQKHETHSTSLNRFQASYLNPPNLNIVFDSLIVINHRVNYTISLVSSTLDKSGKESYKTFNRFETFFAITHSGENIFDLAPTALDIELDHMQLIKYTHNKTASQNLTS